MFIIIILLFSLYLLLQYFNIAPSINNLYSFIVFHPPKNSIFTDFNMDVCHKIKSKNGKSICYYKYLPKNSETEKYIIWSHGNAMNANQLSYYFTELADKLNVKIIAYDYQGYGHSEGYCSEKNCYEDLESIVENMIKFNNVDPNNIFLVGQSLGTGVVIDYISKHKWNSPVMLISPYKSMIRVMFPNLGNLLGFMDMFNTITKLKKVKCPVKIIHGIDDDIIDINHSYDIFKNLVNKSLDPLYIKYCGHNDILPEINENIFVETFNL